jgi:phosphatidylserine/phosphatidylglycerophosphate/cardiolipin synthase-like enzyme
VPIWIDDQARVAPHAKTMVIDGAVTLMGSMNWTRGAAANSEDLNLISSPAVAAAYAAHWRQCLAVSVRFRSARRLVPGFVRSSALMLRGRSVWPTAAGRQISDARP